MLATVKSVVHLATIVVVILFERSQVTSTNESKKIAAIAVNVKNVVKQYIHCDRGIFFIK